MDVVQSECLEAECIERKWLWLYGRAFLYSLVHFKNSRCSEADQVAKRSFSSSQRKQWSVVRSMWQTVNIFSHPYCSTFHQIPTLASRCELQQWHWNCSSTVLELGQIFSAHHVCHQSSVQIAPQFIQDFFIFYQSSCTQKSQSVTATNPSLVRRRLLSPEIACRILGALMHHVLFLLCYCVIVLLLCFCAFVLLSIQTILFCCFCMFLCAAIESVAGLQFAQQATARLLMPCWR